MRVPMRESATVVSIGSECTGAEPPLGQHPGSVRWSPRRASWEGMGVTDDTAQTQQPAQWLTLPDVAERLSVPVTRVHQMIRDNALIAVRRDGVLRVPAELVAGDAVRKHLPGVLTLLHDAGYSDEEALWWLYTADHTLPGTPAVALSGPRATEVKRRAQALGF